MAEATGTRGGDGGEGKTLAQALGPPASERMDPDRVHELAAMLVDFAASLDQVVWSTWKIVNPDSPLKRASPARVAMARFVAGEAGTSREQVRQDLERLRQLAAAMTAAVAQAGRVYAQKHVERFAPGEIEKLAKMSGAGGVLVGQEVKCWRKYAELAGPMDAQAIEREVVGAMSTYAESLLKGLHK